MEFFAVPEPVFRILVFAVVFVAMALLERRLPRRHARLPGRRRWVTNIVLAGLGSALVRLMALLPQLFGALVVPIVAVAAAVYAAEHGWGLFNAVAWPAWLEILLAVVILDFAIWLQHLASHKVPLLWRLHRVHHADPDFDLTTGIRFHPIEIGLSMLYKVVWVLALGPAALAVVLFEVILNAGAMFNHANVALPGWLDSALRLLIVTPDMHRVHHSVHQHEHDTNYGFNLSLWDRAFGTYRAQPQDGHVAMTIGLEPYQSDLPTHLSASLLIPFSKPPDLR